MALAFSMQAEISTTTLNIIFLMQIVQFVSVLLVCHRLLILYEALSAILILAVKREKCSVLKFTSM